MSYSEDNEKSPIKKLRSREVVVPEVAETFKNKKMRTNRWSNQIQEIDDNNSCLGNTAVVECLNKFLTDPESQNFHRNKVNVQEFKKNGTNNFFKFYLRNYSKYDCLISTVLQFPETFIKQQLQLLLDDEEWTKETNSEVTRALLDSQKVNTIAL